MAEVAPPIFHNPSVLYQEKIDNDRKAREVYHRSPLAPKDKIAELHTEPEWLIPELRSWKSLPVEARMERIKNVIEASELTVYKKEVKDKCLRFIMTQETERALLIMIVNFIAPKQG